MDQQKPHYPRTPQQQPSYIPTRLRTFPAAPPFLRLGSPDQESPFYLPINEQPLNAAFASLSLSAQAPLLFPTNPDPPFVGGPTPGLRGAQGFAPPLPPQYHHDDDDDHQYNNNNNNNNNDNDSVVSLKNLRFQNGQMGSGLGPLNPLMGPTPPSPLAAAALPFFRGSSWPYGSGGLDLVSSRSTYGCLGEFDYLGSKKPEYQNYPNAQFTSTGSSSSTSWCSNSEAGKKVVLDFVDMKGRFVLLAKDQHCSKMLQVKLMELSEGEIDVLLTEIVDYIGDLMKNQFGNYVVQKLITVCNENQRTRIILSVRKTVSQLISICLNQHGTRGIQKLLETVTCPLQVSLLMAAISPGAATLANDQNGHHVIVYCLKHFSSEDNVHLLNDIAANCFEVAIDKSGCCVMQTCLHTRGRAREHLVNEIIAIALHLAEHPYGNYVLQHMLGLKELNITTNLLRQLEGHYLSISCNKYGSNVVEKCLVETTEEQSSRVILELVRSPNASMILRDPFGNFVIQLALSVAKGLARNALVQLILMNASTMRTNIYGKKILSCLEKKKIKLV